MFENGIGCYFFVSVSSKLDYIKYEINYFVTLYLPVFYVLLRQCGKIIILVIIWVIPLSLSPFLFLFYCPISHPPLYLSWHLILPFLATSHTLSSILIFLLSCPPFIQPFSDRFALLASPLSLWLSLRLSSSCLIHSLVTSSSRISLSIHLCSVCSHPYTECNILIVFVDCSIR